MTAELAGAESGDGSLARAVKGAPAKILSRAPDTMTKVVPVETAQGSRRA